jgi:hypothetical protein
MDSPQRPTAASRCSSSVEKITYLIVVDSFEFILEQEQGARSAREDSRVQYISRRGAGQKRVRNKHEIDIGFDVNVGVALS